MLDRVSVSVSLATIIAVLAKVGILYAAAQESWFKERMDQEVLYFALIAIFLIFFRGKMMHDDSAFFKDLEGGEKFKNDSQAKARIKSGLMAGYLAWLCWVPAIYFLERPPAVGWWLLISLGFSTAWLLVDIVTRKVLDTDPEAKKRPWFLFANILYAIPLILLGTHAIPAAASAAALVFILLLDWLFSDSFGPFA